MKFVICYTMVPRDQNKEPSHLKLVNEKHKTIVSALQEAQSEGQKFVPGGKFVFRSAESPDWEEEL